MKIGKFLQEKRQEKGYSQSKLSRLTGINKQQISDIETKGNPTFSTILKIGEALGIEEIKLKEFYLNNSLK